MATHKPLIISGFLLVVTLLAFWQVTHSSFINFDDNLYITENSQVKAGLTQDGILWAFTTGHSFNWHPLTWISHMVDVDLFGLNPRGHHSVGLLFHIANTLLLFFVLHRMTNALWRSAFVAALFALHPLHVESVAWAAERKDVLSTFFWMLTMGSYGYYAERPSPWKYLLVLLFFSLGLMAKPMVVTLPFVLLLLDYWPLRRFKGEQLSREIQTKPVKPAVSDKGKGKSGKKKAATKGEARRERTTDSLPPRQLVRSLFLEKIPLFLLTILSSVITYRVQQKGGAVKSVLVFPLISRTWNAFISYAAYIEKTVWPHNLAIFYPYQKQWASWQVLTSALFFFVATIVILWAARRFRYLFVGWFWYVGTLVPVIGLVQVGSQAMADRYTYVPLIGLFIMMAWGIPELLKRWRYREPALIASSTMALLFCFVLTWTQAGYWRDNLTLFTHAVSVTNDNYMAYYMRGTAYSALGNKKQAIADYDKAINFNPALEGAYNNRGNTYSALGDYDRAIADYDRAIAIDPNFAEAYDNRGEAYAFLGNQERAVMDYDKAIEIDPKIAFPYRNRAISYDKLGDKRRAYEDLCAAASLGDQGAQNFLRSKGMSW